MTIQELVAHQKKSFRNGKTRTQESREKSLQKLKYLIKTKEKELCKAIENDFGKPYFESYITEIYTVLHEIDIHLKSLASWMKPESVGSPIVTFPSKGMIYNQPLGTVLIIGAWNYPIHLTMMPLIGAISAGNTAVLKPSELAPKTSAILKTLFDENFDSSVLAVVEGSVGETTELLQQPFDHIFFTGSTRVGKIVMKAAAEKLIPVTLELGGKSPAIVHKDANLEVTAKRVWWGKTMNAGQICVAPDFVLIHKSQKEEFIRQTKKVLPAFFGDGYHPGENYTQIVNDDHFKRLKSLLDKSRIIVGGITREETRFIEPTLIDAGWNDEIMQEEIFGPLLPMVTYETEEEVVDELNKRPSPLALYLFSDDSIFQNRILEGVPFGGGCINDTINHLGNHHLPFGGVGNSGMGAYHGKTSFETFSRKQSVLKKPTWPDPDLRYPPYNETKLSWFKKLFS
jgi:aldehyde dehydrogenase (NAD+)